MSKKVFLSLTTLAAITAAVFAFRHFSSSDVATRSEHTPNTDDKRTLKPPAWIPDTLCSGKSSIDQWTQTDQYRLDTGDMFFEWHYDEKGDSCLIAIVTRLPAGTIERRLQSTQ